MLDKKLLFKLIFAMVFHCFAFSQNVVFVHLGEDVPRCIFTTMKQARYLNPDCPIYLLADKGAYSIFQTNHEEFFTEENISLIDMEQVPVSHEHQVFHTVNKIDPTRSNGFWFYATERFFTLFDFVREKSLTDIVHLESDSMLYVELDELLPRFQTLNTRLAAPFQSRVGCIPCFVFIKDQESLSFLMEHILSEMKEYKGTWPHLYINDMQTLASFYKKFGSDYLTPLPTLMPEYKHPKRKSLFSQDNQTSLNFLSLHASLFPEYIFDAAGLGIFLNGNNRATSPHTGPGTIHSRSLFDPSFFSFIWQKEVQGCRVPYLSYKGKSYKIVNLHFHSKMPEDYTSF